MMKILQEILANLKKMLLLNITGLIIVDILLYNTMGIEKYYLDI